MAISVNMLRWRLMMEAQPRWKNGHPAQRTTGVARANSSQPSALPAKRCCSGLAGSKSESMMASSGSVRAAAIQRRRVMLSSSGFDASRVAVIGSSAMPQMGQIPGLSRTISGSIGQVY